MDVREAEKEGRTSSVFRMFSIHHCICHEFFCVLRSSRCREEVEQGRRFILQQVELRPQGESWQCCADRFHVRRNKIMDCMLSPFCNCALDLTRNRACGCLCVSFSALSHAQEKHRTLFRRSFNKERRTETDISCLWGHFGTIIRHLNPGNGQTRR
jgi:hypothetical protein